MKVRQAKKFKYRGTKSEILEPVVFEDFEIKSLKHGNTCHVLYRFPSKAHDWEMCWTMDLQTAKTGVAKYLEHLKDLNQGEGKSPVESKLS